MVKRIKSFTLITSAILFCSFLVACSTLVTPSAPPEISSGDAFADPVLDLAVMSPQEDDPTSTEEGVEELSEGEMLQEKNQILIERYLENAGSLKDELKYEEAEQQLLEALSLSPTDNDVLQALEEIQALLGDKSGGTADAAERYEIKKQQMKHKALDTFQKGKVLKDRAEYSRALVYFENVINQIKWSNYSVNWGTLEEDAKALHAECERLQSVQDADMRLSQEREAFERIRDEELNLRAQTDQQIGMLLEGAIDKFIRQDFDGAQELAQQILKLDPKSDKALELVDNIEEARRQADASDYVIKKREAYLQWKDEIEATRVPYFGILNEAEEEDWARITQLRSTEKNLGIDDALSPDDKALRIRLRSTRADFNFEEEELGIVANVIHNFTGIPVVVDSGVRMELEDNAQTISLPDLKDISVEALLNIIAEMIGEGLTWTVNNGVVVITKQEKLRDNIKIRIHSIKDITFGLTDFYGPEIGTLSSGSDDMGDSEMNPFGGEVEKVIPIPVEDVENLIRENIARGTWDLDMFSLATTQDQGNLLVIHTPEIQKQVADFLDDMRRFSSLCVTIESRFITINDSFIQEIGADFRGINEIPNPNGSGNINAIPSMDVTNGFEDNASRGMDNQGSGGEGNNPSAGVFFNDNSDGDIRFRNENIFQSALGKVLNTIGGAAFQFSVIDDTVFNLVVRAVEKSYNATEITAPVITAFNTQRSYITVINQVSFVKGFDVDVATSAFIANPNIGIIQSGIVLDVRPTVSYDRKFITLEIQTTVADLERPLRQWDTPLAGQTTPVTFQLPVLNVSSASTTVVVPDGGSLVLGGLKYIRYVSRTAETPFLGKIPIVGFFFREKGLSDEVMNLIILARAYISDMNEIRERTKLSN